MKLAAVPAVPIELPLNENYLLPSVIAVGIVPLIVHEHLYNTHLENEEWFAAGNSQAYDYFLFYKQWAVIILALVCLLLLLIRAKNDFEELPWEKKAFIPPVIFCVCVFLSACFSKKPVFAFGGGFEMFQSALTLISYLILCYYTYSCIRSVDHVLYLLRGSEGFVFFEMVICLFQSFGLDLFDSKAGKYLILDPSNWSYLDSYEMNDEVYGTIYAVDYMTVYLVMIIPLAAVLLAVEKERKRRILHAAVLAMALAVLARGSSSAGKLALPGAIVAGALVLASRSWKRLVPCIAVLAALLIAGLSVWQHSDGIRTALQGDLDAGWPDIPFEQITTGDTDEGVTVSLKDGRTVRFLYSLEDDGSMSMEAYDGSGNPLELTLTDDSNDTYVFADSAYSNMWFYRSDDHAYVSCLAFVIDSRTLYFMIGETVFDDGSYPGYYLISTAGRLVKLPQENPVKTVSLFPNGFLNNRGRLWNKTIPLLPHYIVIGAGADNFIMACPQRDYINDYYVFWGQNLIDVKAHSYYLQMWVQEGFVAFAAMMVFFFWYLGESVRLYRKIRKDDTLGILGFGTFLSVVSYLIMMLTNDSMVCTAPVFWCILGLGWGINVRMKKREMQEDAG